MDRQSEFLSAARQCGEKVGRFLMQTERAIMETACEIRLRLGQSICICTPDKQYYLSGVKMDKCMMDEVLRSLCQGAVYSRQHELSNGFLPLKYGHRAGVCGTAVHDGQSISMVRNITSICIRVAREFRGCANDISRQVFESCICGLLISGAPGTGKTTILRDLARGLSLGEYGQCCKVAVLDERGEIALSEPEYTGASDVLCGYPKKVALSQAVRTLSPNIVICDEIAIEEEMREVSECMNCGVMLIASIHAGSIDELRRKPHIRALKDISCVKYVVQLRSGRVGEVEEIAEIARLFDEAGSCACSSCVDSGGDIAG